jgi:hypothetical protein
MDDLPPNSEWAAIHNKSIESDYEICQCDNNSGCGDKDDREAKEAAPSVKVHRIVVV